MGPFKPLQEQRSSEGFCTRPSLHLLSSVHLVASSLVPCLPKDEAGQRHLKPFYPSDSFLSLFNAFTDVLVATGLWLARFHGDLHISNAPLGRSFNHLLFLSPQNSPRTELWSVFCGLAIFLAAGRDGPPVCRNLAADRADPAVCLLKRSLHSHGSPGFTGASLPSELHHTCLLGTCFSLAQ